MILRGDVQQVENAVMTVQSSNAICNIVFSEHFRKVLQSFSQGDRVLVYLPRALPVSETDHAEYDEESRIFKDTFKYISDLRRDKYSDIIVLCTTFKPLVPTRGTDSLFSLGLLDHSGSIELKSFIKECDFRKFVAPGSAEDAAFSPGDVLLLRNVKRGGQDNVAMIYRTCEITKIEDSSLLGDEKKMYEGLVAQFLNTSLRAQLAKKRLLTHKTKKIEQIRDRSFFNILGKVLYCDFDAIPTVCITDFTTNGIAESNAGPFPSNAILVTKLFGHHAELCTRIQLDKYYLFMNIRVHSFSPSLEAYMHDSLEGDVVLIESQELLEEILESERLFSGPEGKSGVFGHQLGDTDGQPWNTVAGKNSSGTGRQNGSAESCNRDECGTEEKGGEDIVEELGGWEASPGTDSLVQEADEPGSHSKQADIFTQDGTCGCPCCGDGREREMLNVAKLSQINIPGIFLSSCLIRRVEFLESAEGVTSRITVEENSVLHVLDVKQKLTRKLLSGKSTLENRKYKCLVLKTGNNKLFMVDLFVDEMQYRSFEAFYLSS